jgi:hypothetical protein
VRSGVAALAVAAAKTKARLMLNPTMKDGIFITKQAVSIAAFYSE